MQWYMKSLSEIHVHFDDKLIVELTGSHLYYWFLTTLQLFRYFVSALFSSLSGASEIISLSLYPVKRFFYEFYQILQIFKKLVF